MSGHKLHLSIILEVGLCAIQPVMELIDYIKMNYFASSLNFC